MSYHEYRVSQLITSKGYPFYAMLFAMIRQADSNNLEKIKQAWPARYEEFMSRYHSPGGLLGGERPLRHDSF